MLLCVLKALPLQPIAHQREAGQVRAREAFSFTFALPPYHDCRSGKRRSRNLITPGDLALRGPPPGMTEFWGVKLDSHDIQEVHPLASAPLQPRWTAFLTRLACAGLPEVMGHDSVQRDWGQDLLYCSHSGHEALEAACERAGRCLLQHGECCSQVTQPMYLAGVHRRTRSAGSHDSALVCHGLGCPKLGERASLAPVPAELQQLTDPRCDTCRSQRP